MRILLSAQQPYSRHSVSRGIDELPRYIDQLAQRSNVTPQENQQPGTFGGNGMIKGGVFWRHCSFSLKDVSPLLRGGLRGD